MPEFPSNTQWSPQPDPQDDLADGNVQQDTMQSPETPLYTWRAHEFIEHKKGTDWYIALAIVATILGFVLYLISSKDLVPVGVVLITAIAFGIFASRKPRELEYTISTVGVRIESRLYPFSSFKSFAVVEEDGTPSIWLMPLKRFMPIISLYFKGSEDEQIIDALSVSLPFESREPGLVDHLMQRLKF